MLIRNIEICPRCGQWMPWRKVSTKIVKGERTQYSRCCRCGTKETIIYRNSPKVLAPLPNVSHSAPD